MTDQQVHLRYRLKLFPPVGGLATEDLMEKVVGVKKASGYWEMAVVVVKRVQDR